MIIYTSPHIKDIPGSYSIIIINIMKEDSSSPSLNSNRARHVIFIKGHAMTIQNLKLIYKTNLKARLLTGCDY